MRFTAPIFFFLIPLISLSQTSNLRVKAISLQADSTVLDTVSIVPGSLILMSNNQYVDTGAYHIDYVKTVFTWNKNSAAYQQLISNSQPLTSNLYYRVFPFSFTETLKHKDVNAISKSTGEGLSQFIYNP